MSENAASSAKFRYALVTPARNEATFIEMTIRSVLAQTAPPVKWVIVSDGSTDGTDQIVARYLAQHPYLDLAHATGAGRRSLGSQIAAFRFGYNRLRGSAFDFVGKLDADVSFEPDYFERLLERFAANPRLGIGGGTIHEPVAGQFRMRPSNRRRSVPGPIQLLRRECYESIGGFLELPYGGADGIAEVMARMKGWEVESFFDLPVRHHRPMGTAERGPVSACLFRGLKDYSVGNHPLYEALKCLRRWREPPVLLSVILRACGYGWGWVRRTRRGVPPEVMAYQRAEQLRRLRGRVGREEGDDD